MSLNPLDKIKAYDETRPGFKGEHWLVLAAGMGVWLASRNNPSFAVRTLGLVAGSALVARAASGREGLQKLMSYLPVGHRIQRQRQLDF